MRPDDKIRLQHILDESQEALHFVANLTFEAFQEDSKTVHAVIRSIEVIGEAAAKISPEYKASQPSIPWEQIVGMRNHLIHVYFDVDYETVWKTVKNDIPMLMDMVKRLLSQ